MHDLPGTTRDAIDTVVETEDGPLRFVDTAGMRRKSRIDEPTEYYSLVRALEAIDRADAALLVIDATEGVTHQDQRLAERIDAAGTAVVIVLNKWDLLDDRGARAGASTEVADRLGVPLATRRCCRSPRSPAKRVHHLLPGAARGRGGVPPADPDRRRSTGCSATPRRATRRRSSAQAPAPDPLRDPGRDRPADVHAVRDPPAAADLPAVPRAHASASRSILGPTPIKLRVRRRNG